MSGMNFSLRLRIPQAAGLAFAVFFLLAGLLAPGSAEAAWPGGNGTIAFVRGPDIWVQQPSGKQRRLTHGVEGADSEPTYSRDGRMIAFVRYAGNDSDIWVMNSDGAEQRPVTTTGEGTYESQPAFFPSGRSLAFARSDPSGEWTVYSVSLDGTGEQVLAVRAKNPAISANGRSLVFARHPGGYLRLKDLSSGEERQIHSGAMRTQEPDFSPDGKRLVFSGQQQCGPVPSRRRLALMTIGLHEAHARVLLTTCHRSFIPYNPTWSPRGNRILFVRRDNPGEVGATSRLQLMTPRGVLVAGAPRHREGESTPSWQPLR
jgi:Tol biopolymer transport system component